MAYEAKMQDKDLEVRYERYKGIIKNFTLMSDIFMRNVFKQRECLEYVLQVIMEKKNLQVVDEVVQKDYKNLQGRSAVLDCVAKDLDGNIFNVEIQQDNRFIILKEKSGKMMKYFRMEHISFMSIQRNRKIQNLED